jgi:hypothetical protein
MCLSFPPLPAYGTYIVIFDKSLYLALPQYVFVLPTPSCIRYLHCYFRQVTVFSSSSACVCPSHPFLHTVSRLLPFASQFIFTCMYAFLLLTSPPTLLKSPVATRNESVGIAPRHHHIAYSHRILVITSSHTYLYTLDTTLSRAF